MTLYLIQPLSQFTVLGSEEGFLCLSPIKHELGINSTLSPFFYRGKKGVSLSVERLNNDDESGNSVCLEGGISLFFVGFLLYLQMR